MLLPRVFIKAVVRHHLRIGIKTLGKNHTCTWRSYSKLGKTQEGKRWVDEKTQDRHTTLDLARREAFAEEEDCPYSTLKTMNVSTEDRLHNFSVSCDTVLKLIKIGIINKIIAVQYCHYLAHLTRSALNDQDRSYYGTRCSDLALYLLRKEENMTHQAKYRLIVDVANTTAQICDTICARVLAETDLGEKLSKNTFIGLLSACYINGSWSMANKLIQLETDEPIQSIRSIDSLVARLVKEAENYQKESDISKRKFSKNEIMEHLVKLSEKCGKTRAPFITRNPQDFLEALKRLEVAVVLNPTIKMSGRCTSCNSILPVYDSGSVELLHASLRELLHAKTTVTNDLYINSTGYDLKRFDQYLKAIYERDRKPIDCVIDGLNVGYRNSTGFLFHKKVVANTDGSAMKTVKVHNPNSQTQVLINTIIRGNMLEKFRKILVIGKNHMRGWPGLEDFFIKHSIHFFTSADESKDDLFQLFAATLSPKTILITNDFFRDHVALLKGEDRMRLERWIDTHQAWILNKNLKPVWPTVYEKLPSFDKETGHIHIPVIDFNRFVDLSLHEPPPHLNNNMTRWICFSTKEC